MAKNLFALKHNGQAIGPEFTVVEPGELSGEVLAYGMENASRKAADAELVVFKTPIAAYVDLEVELKRLNGEEVTLGDVAFHELTADRFAINLSRETVHDVFCFVTQDDGTKVVAGGGRYAVTDSSDFTPDNTLTFDETKFFGVMALGLSIERAQSARATVSSMTAWDNHPGRYIIAGFDLGPGRIAAGDAPGVMSYHNGHVEFYHGRTAAQTRDAAGITV